VTIERVASVSDELVEALRHLIPQMSPAADPVTREHLVELVADARTALFVARDAGSIVGSLTLATYRIPTGRAGWIEDVVVDESARGRGIGEALTEAAKQLAREWRLDAVGLTSRPEREAANRLYRRLGFEQRETNVYRWNPGTP
jgi:ribosomal protein S18 acetylase RimI-like enzyme